MNNATYETAKTEEQISEVNNNVMQMGVPDDQIQKMEVTDAQIPELEVTDEQLLELRKNKDVDKLFRAFAAAQKKVALNLLEIRDESLRDRMAVRITEKLNVLANITPSAGKCPPGTTFNPETGFCE